MKQIFIRDIFVSWGTVKLALMIPLLCIAATSAFASETDGQRPVVQQQQGRTVTGTVRDNNNNPVVGAYVAVVGTGTGALTEADGAFSIPNVPGSATLSVSCYGYIEQQIAVGNRSTVNVSMEQDSETLEDVVVIGYGTQRKGDVSSAISSVKADDFKKVPTVDVAQLIRGQVAGLAISTPNGNPLGSSQINIRGSNTITQNATPLVLIDGIPGSINSVSPDDIAQIDVLKDGSAAAIYGTRGNNGVILITTKNAAGEMPTQVDINAYVSTQRITRRLDFMSADEYRKSTSGKPGSIDDGSNTDWLNEVMQAPVTQIYNISLRGGSKTTNYVASFEYRGIKGLMKRTQNKVIYPRLEVTHRMFNNKVKINGGMSGYKQDYWAGADNDEGFNTGVYRNALTFNPTSPVKNADGVWTENPGITDYFNPVALMEETDGSNQATFLKMFGSVTYTPFEGLDIKYLASSNVYNQARGYYETTRHINSIKSNRTGFASRGTNRTQNDLSEFTVNWRKSFGDHSLNLMGGYSWMRQNYQFYWMQNYNFPSDDYTYNGMQNGAALAAGRARVNSEQTESKLIGYFGRFNYSYKGRYMLSASVRHEGSSKFGADHKWGTFPAVSGAWSVKDEPFMESVNTITALKLRAGYGITGAEPGQPYRSLNTLSFGDWIYYDGEFIKSIRPGSNANPDLRWERKAEFNVGVDVGLLGDRLNATVDYYRRTTTDLLWTYNVPLPPFLYNTMYANGGHIRNTGIEVSVSAVPVQTKDLEWNTSMNFSTNKSELLRLSSDRYISSDFSDQGWIAEPMQTYTHRIQVGEPIGNFYGFKSIDIDNDGYWIIEGADGQPKSIKDQQPDDKKFIGNAVPKYYLSWNNTVRYKNFDLNVMMRGAFGFHILNYTALQFGNPTMLSRGNLLNSTWDKIYDKVPLASDQGPQWVSYYVEKGDYWKIDDVTLGYTFGFKSDLIRDLRVYVTASNLATITGYSGLDPEMSISGLTPGVDNMGRYPAVKTYTFGVSLKF